MAVAFLKRSWPLNRILKKRPVDQVRGPLVEVHLFHHQVSNYCIIYMPIPPGRDLPENEIGVGAGPPSPNP